MSFLKGFCTGGILLTPLFAFLLSIKSPSVFSFSATTECALGLFWLSTILLIYADRGYEFEVNLEGLKLRLPPIPPDEITEVSRV
ncbi:hypothetical protein V6x_07040 [Gimesia chilikensis]|uniref:Uncharacterized protein n=1 Tax=Gimesia chilikensis TaxID=2605989 RepID=A0A517W6Z7_9PLAN|nr:hypothetical protein V6x_07040 [Gimesia chilikensis]